MDTLEIIQLRLLKEDFKKITFLENYTTLFVDSSNYKEHLSDLLSVSDLMKLDFKWEGIPNEETLHKRFEHNSHCLFWKYNDTPIGWAWSNHNVTPLWESSIQQLSKGEIYGGGAFLSRRVQRPPNSGVVFYNLTFDYWLNEMNNDCVLQYSDNWNRVSSIMSYKNGFKNYNFIKEKNGNRKH